jgi:hypothetical protein
MAQRPLISRNCFLQGRGSVATLEEPLLSRYCVRPGTRLAIVRLTSGTVVLYDWVRRRQVIISREEANSTSIAFSGTLSDDARKMLPRKR